MQIAGSARRFRSRAARARGVVMDNEWRVAGGTTGTALAFPVVRFDTPQGTVETRSTHGQRPPRFQAGDPVEVLYEPGDPENARVETAATRMLLPTIFVVVGTSVGLIGCGLLALAWAVR
jgi:hypothetical protein